MAKKTAKTIHSNRKLWLVGDTFGVQSFQDFNNEDVSVFLSQEEAEKKAHRNCDDNIEDSYIIEVDIKYIYRTKSQVVKQPWNI